MSEKVLQKLGRIREALGILSGLRAGCLEKMTDVVYRGAVLHYLYVVADGVVSAAEMIIAARGLRPPQTYREAIVRLGEAGILSADFANRFARIAGFRNFVAHNYDRIDEEIVCALLEQLDDVESFVREIEKAASAEK